MRFMPFSWEAGKRPHFYPREGVSEEMCHSGPSHCHVLLGRPRKLRPPSFFKCWLGCGKHLGFLECPEIMYLPFFMFCREIKDGASLLP